jgi:hypothetical protein
MGSSGIGVVDCGRDQFISMMPDFGSQRYQVPLMNSNGGSSYGTSKLLVCPHLHNISFVSTT